MADPKRDVAVSANESGSLRRSLESLRERLRPSPAKSDAEDGAGPEIDTDLLMKRIRAAIDARRDGAVGTGADAGSALSWGEPQTSLPRTHVAAPPIPFQKEYTLDQLLAYNDADFVRNAFRALLGREPDSHGLEWHLKLLHDGTLSKIDILGTLRNLPEGRRANVRVPLLGLAVRLRFWRRVPIIGRLLGIIQYIVQLPVVVNNIERQQVAMFRADREMRIAVNALAESTEALAKRLSIHSTRIGATLNAQLAVTRSEVAAMTDAATREALSETLEVADSMLRDITSLRSSIGSLLRDTTSLRSSIGSLESCKADLEMVRTNASAAADNMDRLGRSIERLETAKADAAEVANQISSIMTKTRLEAILAEDDHRLDDFYVAFEDQFRGAREDIKGRVSVYLPFVREAGAGTREAPVLDLGCGRGEWIELLRDSGLVARGLDLNHAMVEQCRERGLDAVEADMLEYLRTQDAESLGAITGIHIIEHLSFTHLVALLDETLRTLKPGGVAIFETPNPENLLVGSCNFWYDPTHRHPLPPAAAKFVAEARGFGRAEVLRLHPYPAESQLRGGPSDIQDRLNQMLFGPQDYAIVAFKR